MNWRILVSLTFVSILLSTSAFALLENGGQTHSDITSGTKTGKPESSYLYPIRLVEHGLPEYHDWYAEIGSPNGTNYSTYAYTDKQTMTYYESPGNYSVIASPFQSLRAPTYTTNKDNYQVKLSTSLVIVNIYFIRQYNVSITEVGIPQAVNWSMGLGNNTTEWNGQPTENISTQYAWIPNGTYNVSVGQFIDYTILQPPFPNGLQINGANVSMTVSFYKVNITARGLQGNVSWGANFAPYYSYMPDTSKKYMMFYLHSGNLTMHPHADGYISHELNLSVQSSPLNATALFNKGYKVTFIEHGIPNITENGWSVSGFQIAYNGGSASANGQNSLSVLVPNGTYKVNANISGAYLIINHYDYIANLTLNASTNQFFTVSGNNTTVNLYYSVNILRNLSTPNRINGNGLTSDFKDLLVVILPIAAIAGYVVYTRRKISR